MCGGCNYLWRTDVLENKTPRVCQLVFDNLSKHIFYRGSSDDTNMSQVPAKCPRYMEYVVLTNET